jgi:hypothetical protein
MKKRNLIYWHEIVNDSVGDLPLVVTFCPLCNTAIAFKRLDPVVAINHFRFSWAAIKPQTRVYQP